jgi:hypothetical protein
MTNPPRIKNLRGVMARREHHRLMVFRGAMDKTENALSEIAAEYIERVRRRAEEQARNLQVMFDCNPTPCKIHRWVV